MTIHAVSIIIVTVNCFILKKGMNFVSGHSKWHNIQKTKGAADAKRAQVFTKIAREMIVAVKEGGSGDPANNSRCV